MNSVLKTVANLQLFQVDFKTSTWFYILWRYLHPPSFKTLSK